MFQARLRRPGVGPECLTIPQWKICQRSSSMSMSMSIAFSREAARSPSNDASSCHVRWHAGIAQALPACRRGGATNGNAVFSFIGDGPMNSSLVEEVEAWELENVRFHAQVQPNEIGDYPRRQQRLARAALRRSDISRLCAIEDDRLHGGGAPRDPLRGRKSARLLERAGGGVVVAPES